MPVLFRVHDSVKVSVISENRLKVAVLVLNYNGKRYLKECFESLRSQTYDNYDVFLVDNGSSDGSVRYVNEHFPWVRGIVFKENLGFAKAYNKAIKMVDADLVALLNNDTKVDREWLPELVNAILEDESIAAVGSKILLYDSPRLLNHAGAKITPTGGGFDIGLYRRDGKEYNIKKPVGAVCGAAMLVKKNLFMKICGFDENFFAYFEDIDLCWRMWLCGYKVLYVPTSVVYHKFGGSWGKRLSPIRLYFGCVNKLRNMFKNLELNNLIKGLFFSSVFDIVRILLLLSTKNILGVLAIVRAYKDFVKYLRKTLRQRIKIQKNRKLADKYLYRMRLVCSLTEGLKVFLNLDIKQERFS